MHRVYLITEKIRAQVQLQIFQVSPTCYTPELGFSRHFYGQQGMGVIHKCMLYTEDYSNILYYNNNNILPADNADDSKLH